MDWLARVFEASGDVLRLQTPTALQSPDALSIAIGVALLAGLSVILGQIAVFRINRMRGWPLALGVAIGATANAALRAVIGGLLGLISWLVDRNAADAASLAIAYLFSIAPQLLGFLAAIPYAGIGISRLLEGWSMLALAVMVAAATGDPWLALLTAGIAWGLGQLLSRLLAHPLSIAASWLWTLISGTPTITTTNDILAGAPLIPLEKAQ